MSSSPAESIAKLQSLNFPRVFECLQNDAEPTQISLTRNAMSAASSIVFYGIRVPLEQDEIEALETRTHKLFILARRLGLDTYWANFGTDEDNYFLLVGQRLGIIGAEDQHEVQLDIDSLVNMSSRVNQQLKEACLSGLPKVHFVWLPD